MRVWKFIASLLFFVSIFLVSCGNHYKGEGTIGNMNRKQALISERAAGLLGKLFTAVGQYPEIKNNNSISLKGKTISLNATIENSSQKEGKTIIGVKFQLSINNKYDLSIF